MVAVPKAFGQSSVRLPASAGVDDADARYRAATLQHLVANVIREEILALGSSLPSFLEQLHPAPPGMGYDRVVRILRGETLMQLADLVTWAGQFARVRELLSSEFHASVG